MSSAFSTTIRDQMIEDQPNPFYRDYSRQWNSYQRLGDRNNYKARNRSVILKIWKVPLYWPQRSTDIPSNVIGILENRSENHVSVNLNPTELTVPDAFRSAELDTRTTIAGNLIEDTTNEWHDTISDFWNQNPAPAPAPAPAAPAPAPAPAPAAPAPAPAAPAPAAPAPAPAPAAPAPAAPPAPAPAAPAPAPAAPAQAPVAPAQAPVAPTPAAPAQAPVAASTQWETIENILQKLPTWKVLQLSIPNNWEQVQYSVIYWKVDWDDLILTLSKNDWTQKWHYKTLVVPKNTVLTDGNLPYTGWYDQWVRQDTEGHKKLENVHIAPNAIDRERLSTYLASVTPTSPVVLSTINMYSDENSKRDFTIIWAKKIGDHLYDVEMINDANWAKKLVRAKVTWTPWSEKIEFEGEYTEPWFLRSKLYEPYASSAIRYVTKVHLWMAKKPSLWEKTREKFENWMKKEDRVQSTTIHQGNPTIQLAPALAPVPVSLQSAPNNTKDTKEAPQAQWYTQQILSALRENKPVTLFRNGQAAIYLTSIVPGTLSNSDYYRFYYRLWNASDDSQIIHIQREALNTFWTSGNYTLPVTCSGSWDTSIEETLKLNRIIIDDQNILPPDTDTPRKDAKKQEDSNKSWFWTKIASFMKSWLRWLFWWR